ncbi:MAG: type IV toxin-antitoxin system AbiEi family antitoxin domain-containing protein [Longispora sp.]|nr:type IV toxin-antitoxin system AbiEi family antitoxin domain-containing protein [Longispora sp. (in: high G+C Gram-positive bacteria)]
MRWDLLTSYTQRQSGLFTRAQAYICGYSAYQVRRRVQCGEWQQVLREVFAQTGTTITPGIRDRAATLGIEGAILAGPSAARLHGAPTSDTRTYVFASTDNRLKVPQLIGLRCALDARDVILLDDKFVTRRGRTTFDCLRLLPFDHAESLFDRVLRDKWTTYTEQVSYLRQYTGMVGLTQVTRLLGRAKPGARSAAERRFPTLLRQAGVCGWQANFPIGNYLVNGRTRWSPPAGRCFGSHGGIYTTNPCT